MVKKVNSIGILGGSFDPPHKGHLFISKKSLKLLKLDKLIWAITKKNPLKNNPLLSMYKRKKLCQKIIKNEKKIKLLFLEKKIKSNSSYKLVKYFKNEGDNIIFFIIGSDNLINLHKWKNYQKLIKICNLVVFSRKGFDNKARKSVIRNNLKRKNIIFMNNKWINISSTQLRDKLLNGNR